MNRWLIKRWQGPGGCAEVFSLALPLTISSGASSIQMLIDRIFLTWYSTDAMAGAMQAGIAHYTIASLFLGTASYVNTFVAQYTGAGRHERVGPAVWQGIYFSLIAGLLILLLIPLTPAIFNWMGHAPPVRHSEIVYFQILCVGALPMLVSSALSSFFTGRANFKIVMYVNVAETLVNIVLDYVLIFGKFGFPRMGVAGAAWATVASYVCCTGLFAWLFFRKKHRAESATLSGWRIDADLFARLIRFGLPNGVQFMLDVCAFALFVMFVGRVDKTGLAATSIAFSINTLAFVPMFGFSTAVSTLVGQALGRNDPAIAKRSTWSAFCLTWGYMVTIALGYVLIPQVFLYPFKAGASASEFAAIEQMVIRLLCFVAFYSLFDSGNIIFSAALKGAGDTRFVMVLTVALSWLIMVVPSWLAVKYGRGVYLLWAFATAYVCILAIVFLLRFLEGKWTHMRVIEAVPAKVLPKPQLPTVEI
jgi:MATE family multidrug resistance protein